MKDPILEEFKVWLTDNGYERIDSQLNITQSAMLDAWKAAIKIGFDRGINSVR
ncbi:MAG: hypothetical protein IH931_03160 [candidate division Zixibacteria bacterium]|nr:hypothetical protein [candidate division Zixibacteria bacterium]